MSNTVNSNPALCQADRRHVRVAAADNGYFLYLLGENDDDLEPAHNLTARS